MIIYDEDSRILKHLWDAYAQAAQPTPEDLERYDAQQQLIETAQVSIRQQIESLLEQGAGIVRISCHSGDRFIHWLVDGARPGESLPPAPEGYAVLHEMRFDR